MTDALRSTPATTGPSPLALYRAHVEQAFVAAPPPQPVHGFHPPTPGGTYGHYTMIDDSQLRIEVELGPLLKNHVFRGSSPSSMVSVWA
jgi:hypothetical protein